MEGKWNILAVQVSPAFLILIDVAYTMYVLVASLVHPSALVPVRFLISHVDALCAVHMELPVEGTRTLCSVLCDWLVWPCADLLAVLASRGGVVPDPSRHSVN